MTTGFGKTNWPIEISNYLNPGKKESVQSVRAEIIVVVKMLY